jgi:GNAT superfamily N-acetyltransferase
VDIRLRPLRDDEWPEFREVLRVEYVRGLVEEAGMKLEDAEAKAKADHESLFVDGRPQESHRIALLEDAASAECVGHLFWGRRSAARAFLYDLFVDERFRGRGVGQQALALLEDEARAEGVKRIWGGNDVARRLYRSAGYEERAVEMSKELK